MDWHDINRTRLLYIFHCFLNLFLHQRVFFCFSKCFDILVVSVIEHRYVCNFQSGFVLVYISYHAIFNFIKSDSFSYKCDGGCWWFRFMIVDSKKNKKRKSTSMKNGMKNVHKLIIEWNLIPWRAVFLYGLPFFSSSQCCDWAQPKRPSIVWI